jgi:hypothetical protein
MRIFIRPFMRALRPRCHRVVGMTRGGSGIDRLRKVRAEASTADAFDSKAVLSAIDPKA